MSIEYMQGDLLSVQSGVIIHGCNALGLMGSGVAKAVRAKYPIAYDKYRDHYWANNGFLMGELILAEVNPSLFVCNMITQEFAGHDATVRYVNYASIACGFLDLFDWMKTLPDECRIAHFPKIGAGRGKGKWEIIEQIIMDCDRNNTFRKICWELPQPAV